MVNYRLFVGGVAARAAVLTRVRRAFNNVDRAVDAAVAGCVGAGVGVKRPFRAGAAVEAGQRLARACLLAGVAVALVPTRAHALVPAAAVLAHDADLLVPRAPHGRAEDMPSNL